MLYVLRQILLAPRGVSEFRPLTETSEGESMEINNADDGCKLSEDALVLAVLFMYLPVERQEEILKILKEDGYGLV